MNIVCLDMEGVLVPEIWIAFSEASGIPELKRTTRDEPDYDKLMKWRINLLRERGIGLKEIQRIIDTIDPLPGAKEFLDELREFGGEYMLSKLSKIDPESARNLHPNNTKRILRALEIYYATGKTMSQQISVSK